MFLKNPGFAIRKKNCKYGWLNVVRDTVLVIQNQTSPGAIMMQYTNLDTIGGYDQNNITSNNFYMHRMK